VADAGRTDGRPGHRRLAASAVSFRYRPGLPAADRHPCPRRRRRISPHSPDFTLATLHRWGTAERSHDIAILVSELVTSALRYAPPIPGDTRLRRTVRLGLLQPGPCLLCAVADPGTAVPVPRRPGSLAETGRGLHIICTLSDKWGYTTPPGGTGKVIWALFTPRPARLPRPVPGQGQPMTGPGATT